MSIVDQIIEQGFADLREALIAGRKLRETLEQIEVSALYTIGPILQIRHTCPHWAVHADRPMTLAQVLKRSQEHRDVCG